MCSIWLRQKTTPLVIFVDDRDRCVPEGGGVVEAIIFRFR